MFFPQAVSRDHNTFLLPVHRQIRPRHELEAAIQRLSRAEMAENGTIS
jgi:hypothetical protein